MVFQDVGFQNTSKNPSPISALGVKSPHLQFSTNYHYQTPHPQAPHPRTPDVWLPFEVFPHRLSQGSHTGVCEENTPPEKTPLGRAQIRGSIGASAAGLQGKGLNERSLSFPQTPVCFSCRSPWLRSIPAPPRLPRAPFLSASGASLTRDAELPREGPRP